MFVLDWVKKVIAPKEIKAAFAALEEADYKFQTEKWTFQIVRREIENILLKNPDALVRVIRKSGGRTPREWVYSQIGNIAGDMLESGNHHVYRGVLNPKHRSWRTVGKQILPTREFRILVARITA